MGKEGGKGPEMGDRHSMGASSVSYRHNFLVFFLSVFSGT